MYQDLWISALFLVSAIIVSMLYRQALKNGHAPSNINDYYITPNKES
jgi:hypothetical protein